MSTTKPTDRTTLLKRADEVLALRLLGAEFADIKAHAAKEGWNVCDRTLWRYIDQGDRLLAKTLEKDRQKLVNRHIAQRRALYARAVSVSDYSTALRILQDECELLGLYPPKTARLGLPEGGSLTLNIVEELIVNQIPNAALPAPVEALNVAAPNGAHHDDDPSAPRTEAVRPQ